jgi:hypothetical protein
MSVYGKSPASDVRALNYPSPKKTLGSWSLRFFEVASVVCRLCSVGGDEPRALNSVFLLCVGGNERREGGRNALVARAVMMMMAATLNVRPRALEKRQKKNQPCVRCIRSRSAARGTGILRKEIWRSQRSVGVV